MLFEGIEPTPGLKSAANWFPRTETLGPEEIRVIFMGTVPFIRPGQMNTSILIQLGDCQDYVYDIGEGSVANYIAAGMALNELDIPEEAMPPALKQSMGEAWRQRKAYQEEMKKREDE